MSDAKTKRPLFRLVSDGHNCFPFLTENPIEAAHYFGRGFHDAGDSLIQICKNEGGFLPDYAAPPIVFLYRHAAELYIKSVIWNGDEVLAFLKKPTSGAGGVEWSSHSLNKLIPLAEKVISSFGLTWNEAKNGTYGEASSTLQQLDQLDPNSFSFRYPVTKKGASSQDPEFGFNLVAFAEPLSRVLEGWFELGLDVEGIREYHMLA
jgi:hypothetical protein